MDQMTILRRLEQVIQSRKGRDSASSYVAHLLEQGPKGLSRKVAEEAVEVVIATLEGEKKEIIRESADLLFHLMVLWSHLGIRIQDILTEIERREGLSGIDEKNNRSFKQEPSDVL